MRETGREKSGVEEDEEEDVNKEERRRPL